MSAYTVRCEAGRVTPGFDNCAPAKPSPPGPPTDLALDAALLEMDQATDVALHQIERRVDPAAKNGAR